MERQDNSGERKPDFDKTFIEGSDSNADSHDLTSGNRLHLDDERVQTAYGASGATSAGAGNVKLPSAEEPAEIGSGTVVAELGTGGMAKVYKVWNARLEVYRAVKILLPSYQTDLLNRFETEAKITAKLHHPNIVEIYSVGEWNGLPYLEMELIDGESLEDLINRQGRLPDAVCSAIAIMVCKALTYAHGQEFLLYGKSYKGIIHRDLKPANIMISRRAEVKLMDFGIARPTETSFHTVEGNIVGTLQYLAPEQIDGVDIDAGADLYALGAILYEMLTGTKTFPQKTITNLMKKKATNEYRNFDDFDFRVHPQLTRISKRCLSVERSERFSDAASMLEALESAHRAVTGLSPEGTIRTYVEDPVGFALSSRRRRLIPRVSPKIYLPAAAVVVLAALVGLIVRTGPTSPTEHASPSGENKQQTTSFESEELTPPGREQEKEDTTEEAAAPEPPKEEPVVKTPPRPTPPRQTTPRRPRTLTPLQKLRKKYGGDNFVAIGREALNKGETDDAILALENAAREPGTEPATRLPLLEAYLKAGRTRDALYQVNSRPVDDAYFALLAGKLYARLGRSREALQHLESALQKRSSVKSRNDVRNDVLYQIALVRAKNYEENATQNNKTHLMQAWYNVKRFIPKSDPRYEAAVRELATIR